jgi:heat shock protein HslJ
MTRPLGLAPFRPILPGTFAFPLGLLLLASCSALPWVSAPGARSAPALAELQNATYQGFETAPGPVTLVDGRWEGSPYVAGGAARPSVYLVPDFRLVGDLTGDGSEEAVVLLGENAGGTGEYMYLTVMARSDGGVRQIAATRLGDRVQIRTARIEAGRIILGLVQAGPTDPMCCPGDLVTREFEVRSEGLTELASAAPAGRLSLDTIGGTEWVLRSWSWDEPAPSEPRVTLRFEGGKLVGTAGCNRYFAPVTAGRLPGSVTVGPAGATRMACAAPAMAAESRFLGQLAGVTKFDFRSTRLALTYRRQGGVGTMLFERTTAGAGQNR